MFFCIFMLKPAKDYIFGAYYKTFLEISCRKKGLIASTGGDGLRDKTILTITKWAEMVLHLIGVVLVKIGSYWNSW